MRGPTSYSARIAETGGSRASGIRLIYAMWSVVPVSVRVAADGSGLILEGSRTAAVISVFVRTLLERRIYRRALPEIMPIRHPLAFLSKICYSYI